METLRYWIAASYLPGLGPATILKLISIAGDIKSLFALQYEDCKAIGFSEKQIRAILHPNWRQVEADLAWIETASHHYIVHYGSLYYPSQLKTITNPPLILYIKGNAAL